MKIPVSRENKTRSMKERRASQKLSSKSIMDPNQNVKCKIVVVGDSQCGKTALLHVFAKDCFPEVSVAGWGCGRAAGKGSPSRGGFPWLSPFTRFSLSCFFFFSSRLFHCLLLSPRLVAGKGKVGWKRGGVGMRLHILLLASETCSVMCAESGIGKFGSSTFGESGWGEREVRAFGKDLRV